MIDPVNKKRSDRIGWLIVAGLLLGVGTCSALLASGNETDTGQSEAVTACEAEIRQQLKAPATADFNPPRISERNVGEATRWEVVGSVDAENGFGANVRTSYRCTAIEVNGTWTANAMLVP